VQKLNLRVRTDGVCFPKIKQNVHLTSYQSSFPTVVLSNRPAETLSRQKTLKKSAQ